MGLIPPHHGAVHRHPVIVREPQQDRAADCEKSNAAEAKIGRRGVASTLIEVWLCWGLLGTAIDCTKRETIVRANATWQSTRSLAALAKIVRHLKVGEHGTRHAEKGPKRTVVTTTRLYMRWLNREANALHVGWSIQKREYSPPATSRICKAPYGTMYVCRSMYVYFNVLGCSPRR